MIRVAIIEDHVAFREALAFMLNCEAEISVLSQAGSVSEGKLLLTDVDVAIINLRLPDGSGVDLVRHMQDIDTQCVSMVLTSSKRLEDIAKAVEAGTAGVIHKSAHVHEIITAVRRVAAGEQLMSPQEIVALLRSTRKHRERQREAQIALARLTAREREVLQALAEGLSDKEIADRLHVRSDTVRTHMTSIMGKLNVKSRLQALLFALRHDAVTLQRLV